MVEDDEQRGVDMDALRGEARLAERQFMGWTIAA
jgi:hypothetical protein